MYYILLYYMNYMYYMNYIIIYCSNREDMRGCQKKEVIK
jgi:hypothetical protein